MRLSHEHLNLYYPLVQWDTVILMLIFQCVIIFHSQSIDFANAFAQADISCVKSVFIQLHRDLKEMYDSVVL